MEAEGGIESQGEEDGDQGLGLQQSKKIKNNIIN